MTQEKYLEIKAKGGLRKVKNLTVLERKEYTMDKMARKRFLNAFKRLGKKLEK